MESHISKKKVNWRGPLGAEVLIITDFPSKEEEVKGALLDSDAGQILSSSLPIPLSLCTIVSLSQYRPDDDDVRYLEGSDALQSGLAAVKKYISDYSEKIKLIITLGDSPLRFLLGKYSIYKWRGSPLVYQGIKVMPNHHPKEVEKQQTLYPIFSHLIEKAFKYKDDAYTRYTDNFTIVSDVVLQISYAEEIIRASESGKFITIDIETRRDNQSILCVGFGLSRERAICFVCQSQSSLQVIRDLLPKLKNTIYHNSLFDIAIKRYFHDIASPPCFFDTMVAQHVLEPELPKGLDTICQLHTFRPCYWADITFDEDSKSWSEKASKSESLWVYNCLDCVTTYECFEYFYEKLKDNPYFWYKMEQLEVAHHMGSTGFLVDKDRLALLHSSQKKEWTDNYQFFMQMVGGVINIGSHKKVQEYLYTTLKLPEKKGRNGKVTADADALVSLIGHIKGEIAERKTEESKNDWRRKLVIVRAILNIRQTEKLISSYFDIGISPDGRVRSVWKVCGAETQRWSCAKWWDDTGFNAQTMPREILEIDIPEDNNGNVSPTQHEIQNGLPIQTQT